MSELAGLAWSAAQRIAQERDRLREELRVVRDRNMDLEALVAELRLELRNGGGTVAQFPFDWERDGA